jgi:hypothetical protein
MAEGDASGTVKLPAACGVAMVFDALPRACSDAARVERLPPAVGCAAVAAGVDAGLVARLGFVAELDWVADGVGLVNAVPSV